MAKYRIFLVGEFEAGEWSGWRQHSFAKSNHMTDGVWNHVLVADVDEPSPDKNHIHYKCRRDQGESHAVLCSVKVDGVRVINRGELLKRINAVIDSTFSIKDETRDEQE